MALVNPSRIIRRRILLWIGIVVCFTMVSLQILSITGKGSVRAYMAFVLLCSTILISSAILVFDMRCSISVMPHMYWRQITRRTRMLMLCSVLGLICSVTISQFFHFRHVAATATVTAAAANASNTDTTRSVLELEPKFAGALRHVWDTISSPVQSGLDTVFEWRNDYFNSNSANANASSSSNNNSIPNQTTNINLAEDRKEAVFESILNYICIFFIIIYSFLKGAISLLLSVTFHYSFAVSYIIASLASFSRYENYENKVNRLIDIEQVESNTDADADDDDDDDDDDTNSSERIEGFGFSFRLPIISSHKITKQGLKNEKLLLDSQGNETPTNQLKALYKDMIYGKLSMKLWTRLLKPSLQTSFAVTILAAGISIFSNAIKAVNCHVRVSSPNSPNSIGYVVPSGFIESILCNKSFNDAVATTSTSGAGAMMPSLRVELARCFIVSAFVQISIGMSYLLLRSMLLRPISFLSVVNSKDDSTANSSSSSSSSDSDSRSSGRGSEIALEYNYEGGDVLAATMGLGNASLMSDLHLQSNNKSKSNSGSRSSSSSSNSWNELLKSTREIHSNILASIKPCHIGPATVPYLKATDKTGIGLSLRLTSENYHDIISRALAFQSFHAIMKSQSPSFQSRRVQLFHDGNNNNNNSSSSSSSSSSSNSSSTQPPLWNSCVRNALIYIDSFTVELQLITLHALDVLSYTTGDTNMNLAGTNTRLGSVKVSSSSSSSNSNTNRRSSSRSRGSNQSSGSGSRSSSAVESFMETFWENKPNVQLGLSAGIASTSSSSSSSSSSLSTLRSRSRNNNDIDGRSNLRDISVTNCISDEATDAQYRSWMWCQHTLVGRCCGWLLQSKWVTDLGLGFDSLCRALMGMYPVLDSIPPMTIQSAIHAVEGISYGLLNSLNEDHTGRSSNYIIAVMESLIRLESSLELYDSVLRKCNNIPGIYPPYSTTGSGTTNAGLGLGLGHPSKCRGYDSGRNITVNMSTLQEINGSMITLLVSGFNDILSRGDCPLLQTQLCSHSLGERLKKLK